MYLLLFLLYSLLGLTQSSSSSSSSSLAKNFYNVTVTSNELFRFTQSVMMNLGKTEDAYQIEDSIVETTSTSERSRMCTVSAVFGDENGLFRLSDWGVERVPCTLGRGVSTMSLHMVNWKGQDCELDTDLKLVRGSAVVMPYQFDETCTPMKMFEILVRARVRAVIFVNDLKSYNNVGLETKQEDITLVLMTFEQFQHILGVYNTLIMGTTGVRVQLENKSSITYPLDVTSGPSLLVRSVADDNLDEKKYYVAVEGMLSYNNNNNEKKQITIKIPKSHFGLIWRMYDWNVKVTRGLPAEKIGLLRSQERSMLEILGRLYRAPVSLLNRMSQILEHAVVIAALISNLENRGGYLPVCGGFSYAPGLTKQVVVLSTMFKVGSMSIARLLWYLTVEHKKYDMTLLKTHHPSWIHLLSKHLPSHIKLSIVQIYGRSDMFRYLSAFFQDIVSPSKSYAYRKKDGTLATKEDVLRENPKRLKDFFSTVIWRDVVWLNPEAYLENIRLAVFSRDSSVVDAARDKLNGLVRRANLETELKYDTLWPVRLHSVENKNVELIVLRFHRFDHDASGLLSMLNLPRVRAPHINRGADKWYSKQYDRLLELIRQEEEIEVHDDSASPPRLLTIRLDL